MDERENKLAKLREKMRLSRELKTTKGREELRKEELFTKKFMKQKKCREDDE